MTGESVRQILLDTPESGKEIRLNDGSAVLVRKREQWIAAPDFLAVLDLNGSFHHIAYRNITSIRVFPANGRKKRKRK